MSDLCFTEIVLRVLAAFVAGLVVGLERESHGRAAGLRTTTLACVASALAMILSGMLFAESVGAGGAWRPDPARLVAGILTGIGFLGAGTILRHANLIRGVTTAASLWFVTVLGLAFGSGQFLLGGLGLLVALATLFLLPALEKHLPSDWYAKVIVTLELDALSDPQLKQLLETLGLRVKTVEYEYDFVRRQKTVTCDLKLPKAVMFELSEKTIAALRGQPGVLHVRWL